MTDEVITNRFNANEMWNILLNEKMAPPPRKVGSLPKVVARFEPEAQPVQPPPTANAPTSSAPTSSIPTSSIPTSSIPTSSVPEKKCDPVLAVEPNVVSQPVSFRSKLSIKVSQ